MKRYYSIDFHAMKAVGLNATQWMILEDINYRQATSESGWCVDARASMAEDHQLSRSGFKKNIAILMELGYIKRNNKNYLKTTPKWHAIQEGSKYKKNENNEVVTKVTWGHKSDGHKSDHQGVTKVTATSYKYAFRKNNNTNNPYPGHMPGDGERLSPHFVKPTLDEVIDQAKRKNYDLQIAQDFFNHFDKNGWIRGNGEVRDWKTLLAKWVERAEKNSRLQSQGQELPEWLDKEAWNEWVAFRKEQRKKLTPMSIKKQIAFLQKHKADHVAIIEQSIRNGWTGLFELKRGRNALDTECDYSEYEKFGYKPPSPLGEVIDLEVNDG